ncbi:FHA domain-containing protein [Butyrivibrio sp. AE2015]|uniref:FHA domain-containing protein n=1 Tax=Butyrivibrio sp. AE2015 TaxID=1280663 RepID=UPI0003B6330D|nr:FHA domain-containing protein [Butyrivibrio sp. AE2015]
MKIFFVPNDLIDLGSTNGSFVNGLKIAAQKKIYIDEGDEVKLGRICFDLR